MNQGSNPQSGPAPAPGIERSVSVSDHELLGCIGNGSYGEVFLARNAMGQFRAVKIVSCPPDGDRRVLEREWQGVRQYEPVSRTHPGLVAILHVGQDAAVQQLYYVMELADDLTERQPIDPETYQARTLQRVLELSKQLPPARVLRLGVQLASALERLHQAGLVHRDIKPANILFVEGQPKLGDIGLVTRAPDAKSIVGTIGFIPPEGPGSRQADIYALGKVLYECLTGLDRTRFPEMPTLLDGHSQQGTFMDVNEVILKACDAKPERRYPSARAMHAELGAIEAGTSVHQLRKVERRAVILRRVALGVAAALAAAVGIGLAVKSAQQHRHERAASQLQEDSERSLAAGDYPTAFRHLAQKLDHSQGTDDEAIDRLRLAATVGAVPKLALFTAWGRDVTACQFSPDDRQLMIATADGRTEILDIETGKPLVRLSGHTNGILGTAFSADGRLAATAGRDGRACVWDAKSGELVQQYPHSNGVSSVQFHPSAGTLLTGCWDGHLRWWSLSTGQLLKTSQAHGAPIHSIAVSQDGRLIVTGAHDGKVRLFNDAGEAQGEPLAHGRIVHHVALSPEGRHLLVSCGDKAGHLWDLSRRSKVASLSHTREVGCGAFSSLGRRLVTGGWDGWLRFWDAKSGSAENPALPHAFPILCTSVSSDGRRIATGCADGTLRVWDMAGKNHPCRVAATRFSENGQHFLWTNNGAIEVTTLGATPARRAVRPDRAALPLGINDAGTLVATVSHAFTNGVHCRVFDVASGTGIGEWSHVEGTPSRCAFSSQRMVALAVGNALHLVDARSGNVRRLVLEGRIGDVGFSPDGRWMGVVVGTNMHVLATDTARPQCRPLPHTATVSRGVYNPASDQLITCTSDRSLNSCYSQAWNVLTGTAIGTNLWHHDGVKDAVWFPDGRQVATVAEDGMARVWNLKTGTFTVALKHQDQAVDVDLANGRALLTASWDKTVCAWDALKGGSIGPPLRFSYALEACQWLGEGSGILIRERGGIYWLQKLQPAPSAPAFLEQVATVLCASRATAPGANSYRTAEQLVAQWNALRAQEPSWFTVTPDEVTAWCWVEGERCRAGNRPKEEMAFNERILAARPDDSLALLVKRWLEQKAPR